MLAYVECELSSVLNNGCEVNCVEIKRLQKRFFCFITVVLAVAIEARVQRWNT